MKIFLNDKEKEINAGLSLLMFLEESGITASRTIITLNGKTLQSDELDSIILSDGDQLELFSFVGGG